MTVARRSTDAHAVPDPRLDQLLKQAMGVGLMLVMLFPFARGQLPYLGWAPLWLLGMPVVAWLALHRFRWPSARAQPSAHSRRRRPQALARRSRPAPAASRWSQAA